MSFIVVPFLPRGSYVYGWRAVLIDRRGTQTGSPLNDPESLKLYRI